MMKQGIWRTAIFSVAVGGLLTAMPNQAETLTVEGRDYPVQVSDGLTVEALNPRLNGPRMMAFASNGDLLIGSKSGVVYRLQAPYTEADTFVNFGGYPHSVAFRMTEAGEELWLAETGGLYRTMYEEGRSYTRADFTLVAPLPRGGGHPSRTVGVGPDQKVYLALGVNGNCSDEYLGDEYPFNDRRGGIYVLEEDLSSPQLRPFASGLRNPVGFAWDPFTQRMFASNNGPDHLGFEEPKEIFAEIEDGDYFGMPWYQWVEGKLVRDRCISSPAPQPAANVKDPLTFLPARNAPMAVAFPDTKDLGGAFAGQAFVALRGSWGTPPDGNASGDLSGRRPPGIVTIPVDEASFDDAMTKDLVRGFQYSNGSRWARPVGLAFGPDGYLYFTSDEGIQGLFRVKPSK